MSRLRGAYRWAAVLLVGVIALALASVFWPGRSEVQRAPLSEDGYYMLSVARNLGTGHGLTIDGENLTNGIQPLFTVLVSPLYWITDGARFATLRGVLAVHWLIHVATAMVLGAVARTAIAGRYGAARASAAFWITAILWLTSAQVLLHSYNGLETGLALLLYAVLWRLYQVWDLHGWRLAVFAATAGLLVLARIDAAILVTVLAMGEGLFGEGAPAVRVRRGAVIALGALAVSSPWWLYNALAFGSLMPTSGAAQAGAFSLWHAQIMLQGVLNAWVPWLPFNAYALSPTKALLVQGFEIGIIGAVGLMAIRISPRLLGSRVARMGAVILLSTCVLVMYYVAFSEAEHFYARYVAPFMVLAVPAFAVFVARGRRAAYLLGAVAVCGAVAFGAIQVRSWHTPLVAEGSFYDEQLRLVQDHVPAQERVGAGQSGTLGYFRDGVVNLDGKVNAEVGVGADLGRVSRVDYLADEGVRWYCDWHTYAERQLGADPAASGWRLVAEDGPTQLYRNDSGSP